MPNKRKPMDPNEKVGIEYGIKSERKGLRGALMRRAISSGAKASTPAAKKFNRGVSKGKAMLNKDKAMAARGGSMPKTKAKKVTRGKKK
jgi:hypothetical protein